MKVQITKPCHEDWEKMKIGVLSRHCEKCEKPVIDFTKMNRAEIITYLLENPTDKVCGRMHNKQFDFQHDDVPHLIDALSKKGGNASFLIMALVCMSLLSCKEEKASVIKTKDPVKKEIHFDGTLGEVSIKDTTHTTKKMPPPQVAVVDPGPSILPEPIYMGEPFVEPPVYVGGIEPLTSEYQAPVDEVLSYADKMPEYPGGMNELYKFIQNNLKYPEFEKENGIQGNVYVRFVVTKEGLVTDPKILRGVNGAPNFDKEVLRVVKLMPNWIPGENGGKKVSVYFTMPVKFKLD